MEQLLISVSEAARLCGSASRGWIYRQVKRDPTFPRLIKLGRRKTVINLAQLRRWAEQQAESNDWLASHREAEATHPSCTAGRPRKKAPKPAADGLKQKGAK